MINLNKESVRLNQSSKIFLQQLSKWSSLTNLTLSKNWIFWDCAFKVMLASHCSTWRQSRIHSLPKLSRKCSLEITYHYQFLKSAEVITKPKDYQSIHPMCASISFLRSELCHRLASPTSQRIVCTWFRLTTQSRHFNAPRSNCCRINRPSLIQLTKFVQKPSLITWQ